MLFPSQKIITVKKAAATTTSCLLLNLKKPELNIIGTGKFFVKFDD
jgi:hypothetical protein